MTVFASSVRGPLHRGTPATWRSLVGALALLAVCAAAVAADVVVIGHRGDSLYAPENTLAAIRSAAGKASMVEFDVRASADGQLVLMHDAAVDRTTNGSGEVADMTLTELQSLDAGSWFAPRFVGEPVPTLGEAVEEALATGLTPAIEQKSGTAADYVAALEAVKDRVQIHSFDWFFLYDVYQMDAGFELVALGTGDLQKEVIPSWIDKVSWRASDLTADDVEKVHNAGKELYAWTVDDASDTATYLEMGVDGLVSNRPALATRVDQGSRPELTEGLLAHWDLDDGGTDPGAALAIDSVNGNAAGLGGFESPPKWLDGPLAKLDGALGFDGVEDYAQVPHTVSLDPRTNAVTLSAWVKLDALPSSLDASFAGIFDSPQDAYVLYLDRDNQELRFKVTDADNTAARPGVPEAALDTENWHHVAGVYDGEAGVARVYFDGQLVDVHAEDGSGTDGLVDEVRTGQVAAMGSGGAGGTSYWPGKLDDVAVWNRPLSQAEVRHLYDGGAGRAVDHCNPTVAGPDPIVYLPLDDDLVNRGTAGSASDGSLVDGGSGTHVFSAGQVGRALDLDNPDAPIDGDYVRIPYTLPEQGTIALWYYAEDFYSYQTIFDNSVDRDDWEMWIYGTGRARFRIQGAAQVDYDLETLRGPDNWYHFAATWAKIDTDVVLNLYVDGTLRDVDEGPWAEPGDSLFLAGGNEMNDHGNGSWDELLVYDTVLTSDEIMALFRRSPIAELNTLIWDGLGDGQWGQTVAATCGSRWVDSAGNPSGEFPDASIDVRIHSDTVTVAADRHSGSLTVTGAALALADGTTLELAGRAEFAEGTRLILGNGARLNLGRDGGTIHRLVAGNAAVIDGEVLVAGNISFSQSHAALTVDGEFELAGDAQYAVELDGPANNQIGTSGDAWLDGTLILRAIKPLGTVGNTTRTILMASGEGSIQGTFANEPPPGAHVGHGVFHRGVDYGSDTVDVALFQAASGDADGNGQIDNADLQQILGAGSFDAGTGFDWTDGDFDGDTDVDNADLQLVLATGYFGTGPYAATVTVVPEPGALALLAVGALALLLWRAARPGGTSLSIAKGVVLRRFHALRPLGRATRRLSMVQRISRRAECRSPSCQFLNRQVRLLPMD